MISRDMISFFVLVLLSANTATNVVSDPVPLVVGTTI